MAVYKYLTYPDHPFAETEENEVIVPDGVCKTDAGALNYALSDSLAILDENGRPFVYKQHKATSSYGCGHDDCVACGGWHSFADGETLHGTPLTAVEAH